MNQNLFNPLRFLIIFASILTCGLIHNLAMADDNLTLYTYQTTLNYPEDAQEHLLIIARRQETDPLPVLLYTTDGTNYALVPLNDSQLADWKKISQRNQQVEPFVELVLGTGVEGDLKDQQAVADFQREKLEWPPEQAIGTWGPATWREFANKIRDEQWRQKYDDIEVIDLNASKGKVPFDETEITADPSLLLAKYDLQEMRAFAARVLQISDTLDERRQEEEGQKVEEGEISTLTTRLKELEGWRGEVESGTIKLSRTTLGPSKAIPALVVAMIVLGIIVIGLAAQILYSAWKADREKEESQDSQLLIDELIRELERTGVLAQLQETPTGIQTGTELIDEMANLVKATNTLYEQIQSREQTSVENSRRHEANLAAKLTEFERKIGEIDRLVEEVPDVHGLVAEVKRKAEETSQALDQIEKELRETRVAAQEQQIRGGIGARFLQKADQLRRQYQGQQEKTEAEISPEKQQCLQKAKELLEGFSNKMNDVQKTIPSSIRNALERVNSFLYQSGQLPGFELPPLSSLQEYVAQHRQQDAASIQRGYQSKVEREYSQALNEYDQQLKGYVQEVTTPRTALTDEKLSREFRDLARSTLNPFDSNAQAEADSEMQQIIAYFDIKVLPPLLDAFGFEAISIIVGQTQATESLHHITKGQPSQYTSGTIIKVVSKGLQVKNDPGDVVQKAQVICAE